MSKYWRALPVLLVAATLLAPVAPASAGWTCSYYRWDAPAKRWRTVAHAVPQDEFRQSHVLGVDYHCEYCYVPALEAENPDPAELFEAAQELVGGAPVPRVPDVPDVPQVPSPGQTSLSALMELVDSAEPLNGPKCPEVVPPIWDDETLDPFVGAIG